MKMTPSLIWQGACVVTLSALMFSSLPSSSVSAATKDAPPATLRLISATAGNSSATLTFSAPKSNGGSKVTYYDVDAHPQNQIHRCTSTTCRVSGLTNGVTYFFTVAAVNKVGKGQYSAPSNKVTPQLPTTTVTFNANGGSGTVANETAKSSVAAALTSNPFTRTGYTFAGWNTSANGSGTTFLNKANYPFTKNVTLYAQWTINTYTVTFNPNGDSGTMANESENFDVTAALTNNSFTYTGYTFAGWNTAPSGVGTSYANGAPYLFTTNVTLYAQWTINTYTVTFNSNGGSGAMANESENFDVTAALSNDSFTYTGYTFNGWNTAPSGAGTSYANGAPYGFTTNVTLYAQWTIDTYIVTFNPNGGSGAMANESGNFDVTAPLSSNSFTYTGYTFNGWNTAASGVGTSYANDALYVFTANVTLYAQWTAVPTSSAFPGETSTNWAGYVLTGGVGGYQGVSAEWTAPTLNCAELPNSSTADWVGVNGINGVPGLFQDGTLSQCNNGSESTTAWWTDEQQNYLTNTLFSVNAGDVIEAEVYQQPTSGLWVYYVKDLTTNQVSTSTEAYSGAGTTAEWIAEDPGDPTTGGLYPLANFGVVTFGDLGLTVPAGSWTLPPYSDAIQMVGANGSVEVLPSPMQGSGASTNFTTPYY